MKTLTIENYKEFNQILNSIKPLIEDLVIQDGKIEVKSNDSLILIKSDISKVFDDTLEFSKLKDKCELLKLFGKVDSVDIDVDKQTITVSDNISKIKFLRPAVSLLNNRVDKKVNHDELFSKMTKVIDTTIDEDKIFRLSTMAKVMGEMYCNFIFEKDTCVANIKANSKEYESKAFTLPTIYDLTNFNASFAVSIFDAGYDFKTSSDVKIEAWVDTSKSKQIIYSRVTGSVSPNIEVEFLAYAELKSQ